MINNNFSKSNCPNFQNEYELFQKAKVKTKIYKFSYKNSNNIDLWFAWMEHLQLLFLKPRTKITIPGHNKLTFGKNQINNG